jgi:hypothetical protein
MKRSSSGAVTRRDFAAGLAAIPTLGAPPANAQVRPQAQDEIAATRQQMQTAIQQLRQFKVPIATEPSFAFRP